MMSRIPVVIAGTNCLSGVTTWAQQLRQALVEHPRYDVRLLYIGGENPPGFDVCVPDVSSAMDYVRKQKKPVILLPNYMWPLFELGLEPNILCVGCCHADNDEQYYRPLSWYEPYISKYVAVSPECRDQLLQRLPFRADDVTTLCYGICLPRELRRDYQTNPLRIVYAGRVTQHQKRVWDFVPLISHLIDAKVSFTFDIVGEGDHFAALKDALHDRFPSTMIRCHARVAHCEMPKVWCDHDVFVQVSEFEGTSVSMLEAMAHGVVPVVTAASSGIKGIIQPGENGEVVPVGDMAAMAQVLAHLAADQSALAAAGKAARQTAQAFSIDSYVEKFTDVLDAAVDAGNHVDVYERYGMFGGMHPLFRQRQLIESQKQEISELRRSALQRLLDGGYRRLLSSKMRYLLKERDRPRAAG